MKHCPTKSVEQNGSEKEMNKTDPQHSLEGIAIVGMSGRFPGASNIDQFWDNLVAGRESLTRFTPQDFIKLGVDPAQANAQTDQARGVIDDSDQFDAGLFGMTPREAEIMDPQQRVFLEVAWEAIEHAGYDHERPPGPIGVFVGCGINTYYMSNLSTRPDVLGSHGEFPTVLLNEKDFLATRLAYCLNLRGPAVNIQTACSTSLVAVCNACQSLLNYECDMALAGAAHLAFPQYHSRTYAQAGIVSQDGHCRPFDHRASGTIFSDGVGTVVLRRLEDAVADGDNVIAVIRGYGLNNDGSDKAGFTAPSVNGQAEVIQIAHALGGSDPESISYIEAHGTGTKFGDPIELAGLSKAFSAVTNRKQFCGIGSVKSNIGHLDVASGVAGLIKTALALQHRKLPPTINYESPNPEIDFRNSPFYVVDSLTDWQVPDGPLRAGVSSFGIGGTNAHLVLEEAPHSQLRTGQSLSSTARSHSLITISAHTPDALQQATDNLANHLSGDPSVSLPDVAFTLQTGRRRFAHRRAVVCQNHDDAVRQLRIANDNRRTDTTLTRGPKKPVFMFPGQGSQCVNMGQQLYESEPVYRDSVDRCSELLMDDLGMDIREAIFHADSNDPAAAERLAQASITQPALFVTEYSLAQLWMSWGIRPHAMIGHSVGEYTAACLANVFTLPKALRLIAARGRLIQNQPHGSMLAIMRSETECRRFVSDRVSIAAINSPSLCVISGETTEIDSIVAQLERESIACQPLMTSHAFHSPMMDPVIEPFNEILSESELQPPVIPFISNVTGDWIKDEQAVSPDYWTAHLRQAVMFAKGIGTILQMNGIALLEVGPGHTLTILTRQQPTFAAEQTLVTSLPKSTGTRNGNPPPEQAVLLTALGQLWKAGLPVDWNDFYRGQQRFRVPLPNYPFQRTRHWIEPDRSDQKQGIPDSAKQSLDCETDAISIARSGPKAVTQTSGHIPVGDTGDRWTDDTLLKILEDLSGMAPEQLRRPDTFLAKGFDSLFLTQFARRIERDWGVPVTLRQLAEELGTLETLTQYVATQLSSGLSELGSPSTDLENQPSQSPPNELAIGQLNLRLDEMSQQIRRLAEAIEAMKSPAENVSAADSQDFSDPGAADRAPSDAPSELEMTDGQREIWLASQMGQDASRTFHESYTVTLDGALDFPHLEECMLELIHRHEALRLTFAADGTTQYIHPSIHQTINVVELDDRSSTEDDPASTESELSRLIAEQIAIPFDLTQGPLSRFVIFKLSESRHVLLFVFHHLVLDGWSWDTLLRDLGAMYRDGKTMAATELGEPQSYEQYVQWSQSAEQLKKSRVDANYWTSVFQQPYQEFELPSAHPRPATKTYVAGHLVAFIDESLTSRLRDASRSQNCTLFSFLLSSFKIWIQRVTQQEDIVVGVPMASQPTINSSKISDGSLLVGHCVNMLPLRSQCPPTEPFHEFLERLNKSVLDSLYHQNFTFGNLLGTLQIKRDTSRVPIISASFNLANANTCDFGQLSANVARPTKSFNYFDLTLDVIDYGDRLVLEYKFNRDLYETDDVHGWISQFQRILDQAVTDPGMKVADFSLLSSDEQNHLVHELNATAADYDHAATLHGLLRQQAKQTPDRIAIRFNGTEITYRELDERSDHLAGYLQKHAGAGPDVLVGVCLDRSIEMVVALLAVLKSGAAYVPLDPAYPADRIAYILHDAKAAAIITDSGLHERPDELPAPAICLDQLSQSISKCEWDESAVQSTSEHLAYVIYTSGSTGKPKGVQVEHRAAVNFLQSMKRKPGLTKHDVLLAVTTISFDIAVLELYLPLITGATVVLAPRETIIDAQAIQQAIAEQSISVMQATPATWRMMLRTGWQGSPSLKVLCGGEPLPTELAKELLPRCGELWNMYGPTETTVWSTCSHVLDADDIHIGRPIDNTQIYIVDPQMNPTPMGVPGELLIGGDGLARDYRGKPELTRQKFIASPFANGQRVYRTGDLARVRQDGTIDCLGRVDFQVKVRGFRIELGEIETVLSELESISQAVVVARPDGSGESQLIAFAVPENINQPPELDDLRSQLRNKLPEYMVPSAFRFLKEMPTTPNGKLDRKSLPDVDTTPIHSRQGHLPATPIEKTLSRIWKKHLRVEIVDINTSFFDLGGHSLIAVAVFQEIAECLNVKLPLGLLINAPTIAGLAKIIQQKQMDHGSSWPSLIPLNEPNTLRPSLYLVHGAGGDVILYQKLIQYLGNDHAVFGLQSQGIDGNADPLTNVVDMADRYVREILAAQPTGPYRIAGYCLGGTIAFEVARLLSSKGHEVASVALLDTYNFHQMKHPGFISVFSQRCYFHARNLLRTKLKQWPAYFASKFQVVRSGELRLLIQSTLPWLFRPAKNADEATKTPIMDLNQAAAFAYVPQRYPGTLTLVTPKSNYSFFPDKNMGWGELADDLQMIELDVLPHAMLEEPVVQHLAEALSR